MPRYIDADVILAKFGKTLQLAGNDGAIAALKFCKKIVQKAPALSPNDGGGVGEWISERDGSIVELDEDGYVTDSCHCSVCNEHLDGSEEYAVKGNYCPNCGAKMEVSEDA